MDFDHLMNEGRAVDFLASKLGEGTLVLILGAGTSAGCGLPDWVGLVERLAQRAGLPVKGISAGADAEQLQRLADQVKREFCQNDERSFASLVRRCLYDGVSLSGNLLRSDLLTALGALMMGSKRGSVRRVVTYNFDSILEWYLHLHGFVPRVIVQPPELEGAEDVRIYHPHGFLPHPDFRPSGSDFVMLGLHAANLRLGTPGDPWFEMVRHLLRTGVGLVVGMSVRSFRDRSIAPLLAKVGDELRGDRPTAFWLLPASDVEGSRSQETARELLDSNVIPLFQHKVADVPPFLLSVCRQAATAIVSAGSVAPN